MHAVFGESKDLALRDDSQRCWISELRCFFTATAGSEGEREKGYEGRKVEPGTDTSRVDRRSRSGRVHSPHVGVGSSFSQPCVGLSSVLITVCANALDARVEAVGPGAHPKLEGRVAQPLD